MLLGYVHTIIAYTATGTLSDIVRRGTKVLQAVRQDADRFSERRRRRPFRGICPNEQRRR